MAEEEIKSVIMQGPAGDTGCPEIERMTSGEYIHYFSSLPRKAIVPECEFVRPGGVVFSESNIFMLPFGCNMIPFGDQKILSFELEMLKRDAGTHYATVPLDFTINQDSRQEAECAFCGELANSKCQNCLSVAYCSREHQKAHWKDHRPFCSLYEVVQSPSGEYSIVAKTNIKRGEVIWIEEPCFTVPFSTNEEFNFLHFQPESEENQKMPIGSLTVDEYESNICRFPVICLGCSIYIYGENISKCQCGWPICGEDCTGIECHHQLECQYFMENKLTYEHCGKNAVLAPRLFGIIRGLLLKRNEPSKWKALLDDTCKQLWANKVEADDNSDARINIEYFFVMLRKVFCFNDLKYSDVNDVLAVIDIKGVYGCSYDHHGVRCRRVHSVYLFASMISHRCVGNVFRLLTNFGTLHIIAAKTIKKGETLYLNHNSQEGELLSVFERQSFALSKMNKPCDCMLCSDVNEGGKHLSSIVCLKCRRRGNESYMKAENPMNINSSWKCFKCGGRKTNRQVQNLLHDISKDIDCINPAFEPQEYVAVLRSILAKYKGFVVHPEHALILAAEYNMIFLLMDCDKLEALLPEDMHYLLQLLNTRIRNMTSIVPEAHSCVVSMKMRVATILVIQMYCGGLTGSRDLVRTFEDLQCIHDDIAQLFVEKTNCNALQGYILICLRKIRSLIGEVGRIFQGQKSRLNLYRKPKLSYRELGNSSFTSHVNGDGDK